MSHTTKPILSKIIQIRKNKGYSLENMADELNISVAAYNKIEKGQTKLTLDRLFQIQQIFNVHIEEILELKEDQKMNLNKSEDLNKGLYLLYKENKEITKQLFDTMKDEIIFLKHQLKRDKSNREIQS